MALCEFPAVVIQDLADTPRDGFDVIFPDFPGCVSSGDSPAEAARSAAEALSLHIRAMVEAGEALPYASARGSLPDWLGREPVKVVALIMVPVETPAVGQRA